MQLIDCTIRRGLRKRSRRRVVVPSYAECRRMHRESIRMTVLPRPHPVDYPGPIRSAMAPRRLIDARIKRRRKASSKKMIPRICLAKNCSNWVRQIWKRPLLMYSKIVNIRLRKRNICFNSTILLYTDLAEIEKCANRRLLTLRMAILALWIHSVRFCV